jgi:hypothetical protein
MIPAIYARKSTEQAGAVDMGPPNQSRHAGGSRRSGELNDGPL